MPYVRPHLERHHRKARKQQHSLLQLFFLDDVVTFYKSNGAKIDSLEQCCSPSSQWKLSTWCGKVLCPAWQFTLIQRHLPQAKDSSLSSELSSSKRPMQSANCPMQLKDTLSSTLTIHAYQIGAVIPILVR